MTCRRSPSSVQLKNVTSHTSTGRTQCTRARLSGEPKRLLRGGGAASGIFGVANICDIKRRRHEGSDPSPNRRGGPDRPCLGTVVGTARHRCPHRRQGGGAGNNLSGPRGACPHSRVL